LHPGVAQVLGRCSSLAKLSLAACQLTGACEELAGLSTLRFLDLSFNQQVSCLSPRLSGLASLSALNLGFCALATWPDVLSCLTSLRELNLDHTGVCARWWDANSWQRRRRHASALHQVATS
jgi:Leucine-rich repeat (LRR) protein